MKAEIKSIYSPDINDLETYQPSNLDFYFLLTIIAGPKNDKGEESFDALVCSPHWFLNAENKDKVFFGRHYIIMANYNYEKLYTKVNEYIKGCEGKDWEEVGEKIGRVGYWEFEDYIP